MEETEAPGYGESRRQTATPSTYGRRASPRLYTLGYSRHMSSFRRSLLALEQQTAIVSPAAFSSSSKTKSRCSGTPSTTSTRQVPHKPSAHICGTSMPFSISTSRIVRSLGTFNTCPLPAISTTKSAFLQLKCGPGPRRNSQSEAYPRANVCLQLQPHSSGQ